MLLNQNERKAIVDDYNRRIGKSTNTSMQGLHLKYNIAPSLLNRITPAPDRRVLGVSTVCNLGAVPPTVTVYDLKSHISADEALANAKAFKITSIEFSLPTETSTFQYLFTQKDNSAFFAQYESSGVYTYSLAVGVPSSGLSPRNLADQYIETYNIYKNLGTPTVIQGIGDTHVMYHRNYDDFMLVDEASIQSFFDESTCVITESQTMGQIQVYLRGGGSLGKIVNNTRPVTAEFKLPSISVDVALAEYGDNPPIDPIVFPATAKLDASRSISLDAAVIAYYDVGVNFGQNLYVPLYIAHGFGHSTTGEDVQVLSFFPVVSSDDLIRHGVVHAVPVSGAESTQQQGTLGFATPTPHAPPGVPLNNPNAGIGGPGCPGGVIDYMVSCSVGGKLMCRGTFTTASTYDPMLACFASCRSHQAVVDTAGGRNPCDAFIKDSGIDATRINGTVPTQQLAPSGSVTCVINACPS